MDKGKLIEILTKWNLWSSDIYTGVYREGYAKAIEKDMSIGKIVSVMGVRRAGKSTLMRQAMKDISSRAKDRYICLYINFDEFAIDRDLQALQESYEAYMELVAPGAKPYIFLDEIQNVTGWERFARSLNERKEAYIAVSGSSSKLSSDELATVLTGRQLYVEVFPLGFAEVLSMNSLTTPRDIHTNAQKVRAMFDMYLRFGGFPEIAITDLEPAKKGEILSGYFTDILTRDIIRRYNVRKSDRIALLAKYYMTNIASPMTYTRIGRFMKLPTETVRRFSGYLESAYLIFFTDRFSFSIKERENSPRKVYSIDNGLSSVISGNAESNLGPLLENIIAVELKRRKKPFNYWRDRLSDQEVDFIVKSGKGYELIQVVYDISNQLTKDRELRSLIKAMDEFKCLSGLVITYDYSGSESIHGKKITYMPAREWLLQ